MIVTACLIISLKLSHTEHNKRLTVPLCPAVARLWGMFPFKFPLSAFKEGGK